MPNTLDHERERFRTMNVRQLRTRLVKITDRQKLWNFIALCREYSQATIPNHLAYFDLMEEAERKLTGVNFGVISPNQARHVANGILRAGGRLEFTEDTNLIKATSTVPSEAHQYEPVTVFCGACQKRVPPKNCNVPVYHLGQPIFFCSEKCKTTSIKGWEIEKRKEGIRVIEIKRRG